MGSIGSTDPTQTNDLEEFAATKESHQLKSYTVIDESGGASSLKIQGWTTEILKFLSTASNETLGACLVGLGAVTYFVLGRVGLVLIGIVGGVILHATWEENFQGQLNDDFKVSEARIRKERGLDIIERVLDWRERRHGIKNLDDNGVHLQDSKATVSNPPDFSNFQAATGTALTSLVDAVIRDYVE